MSEKHAVLTGPISGSVILPDGTEVDVTDHLIYVDSPEQGIEVAKAVSQRYAEEGHPDDPNFTYVGGQPDVITEKG